MVDRTSQEFRLGRASAPVANELNLGQGVYRAPTQEAPSIASQALSGLVQVAGKVVDQQISQSAQTAYLEGQRARMAGEAEAAVEGDVFARPFIHGGYQDQDYRISQAEMSRKVSAFIAGEGQSMSPTQFQEVVRKEAAQFSGQFDNLSSRGKVQAMAAQQSLEASLFTQQAQAYQKWSINEGSKRYLVQGNQIITDLAKAQAEGDTATYNATAERAALLYTDLMTSDTLPAQARTKLATQYLGALANSDQRQVVESLRDQGALNALSFEERKELDTALRQSSSRTMSLDSLGMVNEASDVEAGINAGTATSEGLTAYIEQEVRAKRMSFEQAKNLRVKFLKGQSNQDDSKALMQAVGNRDLTAMAALGFTGAEGIEAMDKQLAKNGKSLSERLAYGIQIGTDIGQLPKSFGDTVGMGVRAIQAAGNGEPVNTELVDSVNSVMSTLQIAEQRNPGARGVLLSSMPTDTQAAMAYALRQQELGVPPAQSLKEFAVNKDAFAQLDQLEQGMRTQKFRQELNDRVDSEAYSGFLGRIGNALRGSANLSSNPYHAANMAGALQQELSRITQDRNNMGLDTDSALDLAVANVQARTIPVGEPGFLGTGESRRGLILPPGVNVDQVFGTSDKVAIGRILSEQFPGQDGFESSFTFNKATGQLQNVLLNKDGQVVSQKPVDAQAVGKRLVEEQDRILQEANAAHFGEALNIGGQPFKIDGGNTYGIPVRAAYRLRKELAGFEGLSLSVYKDRNGLAVGMGHNVTGQGYKVGDTVTLAQAEQWYREDTDAAMSAGSRLATELGVTIPRAIAGLSGAAFQLGAAGLAEHTKTADAIRNKDFEAFKREVRSSEWAKQTKNRTEWFIEQMAPHFQELM